MVVIARGHSSGGHSSGGHSSVVIAQCSEHSGVDSQQLVAFHFLLHCLKPTICLQLSSFHSQGGSK